ncbi:hypothetical protein [Leptospira borgpetersenii]|nr:hypothetical protein [Leptospira borgpetersenii]
MRPALSSLRIKINMVQTAQNFSFDNFGEGTITRRAEFNSDYNIV